MDSPQWWLAAAIAVVPVMALAAALLAYGAYLDKKIEEEERHLPPAE
ncbi:MAG: hypothetical protein JNJ73_16015 [Hyphomonadaceae bacterium]|nr:hypothetical protein [Hyphomonadaceae bacterium]